MSRGLTSVGISGQPRNYGSMSNDPEVGFSPTELYNLSENITTNIYTINSSWRTLERALKVIGTNKDNQGLRNTVHVTQISTNQIIAATGKDLKRLTVVVRKGDKQQKLQVEKLTGDFKEALDRYSEIQKQVADRMKACLLVPVPGSFEESSEMASGGDYEDRARLLAQAQTTARELQFEQGMLVEREERIRQIEADVLDVNQIMRELGALVHQQGEAIDTIENGIETATGNVEQGTSEIQKAAQYQQKYRRKLYFLLLIAVIIGAILITVIVRELKSS